MNMKNFNKSIESVWFVGCSKHANTLSSNDCIKFVSRMCEVGMVSSIEVSAKVKPTKKLRFAKYDVIHPMNGVRAFKSMFHGNPYVRSLISCQTSNTNRSHVSVPGV